MRASRGRDADTTMLRASSFASGKAPPMSVDSRARRDVPHVGVVRPILHVEIDELVAWP
jgi:hypothetical protein